MLLFELFKNYKEPFFDPSEDGTQNKIKDVRKTRLTLRQINKLRRMEEMRKIENERYKSRLKKIYATPMAVDGGMGGGEPPLGI